MHASRFIVLYPGESGMRKEVEKDVEKKKGEEVEKKKKKGSFVKAASGNQD